MVLLWAQISTRCIDYPKCGTKNCWSSVDPHFHDGVRYLRCIVSDEKAAITLYMTIATKSKLDLPRYKSKNHWRSVDAHFQNGAVTAFLSLSPTKAANISVMQNSEQITFEIPYLQDQKSLTLHWRSFWGDCSDVVASIFASKGGQCIDCGLISLHTPWISPDAMARMVDALLMLILRMGQQACHLPFYL